MPIVPHSNIPIEDIKEELLPRILNPIKQPIIVERVKEIPSQEVPTMEKPITSPVVKTITIDILEGLTDFQKEFIKKLVNEQGFNPHGFRVFVDEDKIIK